MAFTLSHQGTNGAQLRVINEDGSDITFEIGHRGAVVQIEVDAFAAMQIAHWIISHLSTEDIIKALESEKRKLEG